jgi:penicillin-binding protein 1A
VLQRFQSSRLWKRIARASLAFDSWVDSSLFESGQSARRFYENFSAYMDRWHVSGWKRWTVEFLCEGLTLGVGGAIFALALAIPAFEQTSEDWLKKQDLAVTFLDRAGNVIGRRGILHDDSLQLDQYPDYLIHALLATEDRRFYDHFGIDILGTLRAIVVNARSSSVVQGGSSITQQLAKNLFLSNERTVERKINEAFLALWLESHLTKKQILTLYLDRAYMGGGTFGVQAAAQFYFGKSVRDVTLAEAAMLAGLFKAPTKYAPHVNLPAARARANDVLNNLVDAGYMTESQVYAARKNPATPVARKDDVTPDYYLDWAFEEVKRLADDGKLGSDRVLTVKTGLDINLQRKAETTLENVLREDGPSYHVKQGAVVVIEPDGTVRAMVGGRDYGASQFNRATEAMRQPGSTFKPFVYLTALISGKFRPTTIVVDSPICIGNWCPHNFGGAYYGAVQLQTALAKSLNTVAVKLSIAIGDGNPKLGRARIVDTARRMGITSPLEDTPSLPIGADAVTVLEMGSAYTTFAGGGKHAPPHATVEVRNSHGDAIYRADRDGAKPQQVINPNVIAEMDGMLINDVETGTGMGARLPGIKAGGKTGTTNAYRDAWFMGFTGNYVGAVWLGNDDYTSTNNMTGGTLPAKIWHEIMAYAHTGIELKPLPGQPPPAPQAVAQAAGADAPDAAPHTMTLSHHSVEIINGIETMIRTVEQKRASVDRPVSLASGSVTGQGSARTLSIGGRINLE